MHTKIKECRILRYTFKAILLQKYLPCIFELFLKAETILKFAQGQIKNIWAHIYVKKCHMFFFIVILLSTVISYCFFHRHLFS